MKTPLEVADLRRARKTDVDVLEESVEDHWMRLAARYGVLNRKVEHLWQGFVDRMALWPISEKTCSCVRVKWGIDFIEFKRPVKGKYRPGQLWWQAKLKKMGYFAAIILTHEAVESYFKVRVCKHTRIRDV